jgi:hypothetical protein
LQALQQSHREEKTRFRLEYLNEKEKSKRLLYLFQKDLMPGISGQILEAKDCRDEIIQRGVSRSAKWLTWIALIIWNASMLFYIFLFAVSQEVSRQRAWAQSFGMWLVVEVLLVSSAMVLITHVLIPSFAMSDVSKIKKRLLTSLQDYHKKMMLRERERERTAMGLSSISDVHEEQEDSSNDDSDLEEDLDGVKGEGRIEKTKRKRFNNEADSERIKDATKFNAAKYLFLSYKMAHAYPELKIAQIITEFSTPWPKQSYRRATDVSKTYDRKFQAIQKAATTIVMFFVTSFIRIPPAIQDMIMQVGTTAVTGYTVLVHLQLYQIYPVLIAVPTILIAAIVHFVVQSSKANSKLEFARLFGRQNDKNDQQQSKAGKEDSILNGAVASKPGAFDTSSLTGVDPTAKTLVKAKGVRGFFKSSFGAAVVPLASSISSANSNYSKILENDASRHRIHPNPDEGLQHPAQKITQKQQPGVGKHHRDRRQSLVHGIDIAKRAHAAFDGGDGELLVGVEEVCDEDYVLSSDEGSSGEGSFDDLFSNQDFDSVSISGDGDHSGGSDCLAKQLRNVLDYANSNMNDYHDDSSSLPLSSEGSSFQNDAVNLPSVIGKDPYELTDYYYDNNQAYHANHQDCLISHDARSAVHFVAAPNYVAHGSIGGFSISASTVVAPLPSGAWIIQQPPTSSPLQQCEEAKDESEISEMMLSDKYSHHAGSGLY